MLNFIKEKKFGALIANSETTPHRQYWIEDMGWTYLDVVYGGMRGPRKTFNSVDEAKAAAQETE